MFVRRWMRSGFLECWWGGFKGSSEDERNSNAICLTSILSCWPYGIAANRKAIDDVLRYHHERGITDQFFTAEDIFLPELLTT